MVCLKPANNTALQLIHGQLYYVVSLRQPLLMNDTTLLCLTRRQSFSISISHNLCQVLLPVGAQCQSVRSHVTTRDIWQSNRWTSNMNRV